MYQFWGKCVGEEDVHLLVYHGLDVAAVGSVYLQSRAQACDTMSRLLGTPPEMTVSLLPLLLALHDIGKFSRRFQTRSPVACHALGQTWGSSPTATHHTAIGRFWWKRKVREWMQETVPLFRGQDGLEDDFRYAVDPLAEAVLGHHGRPAQLPQTGTAAFFATPELSRYVGAEETEGVRCYLSELAGIFTPESLGIEFCDDLIEAWENASWWVAGLAVLADWLGSNTLWFEPCADSMPLAAYWKDIAVPAAERACREAGLNARAVVPASGPRGLFPSFDRLRAAQRLCVEHPLAQRGPRLAILEDETGSGKTEAASLLACKLVGQGAASGIAFLLPTMATANAMFARMHGLFERLFPGGGQDSLMTLSHSKRMMNRAYRQQLAAFSDNSDGVSAAGPWLADNRKKALLAPLCVGTIDQALMAAINTRHQALRLFGLSRHVLIADEIHACDAYMLRILENLLQFHAACGGAAILLTATLPMRMRQRLVSAFAKGAGWNGGTPTCRSDAYPLLSMVADGALEEIDISEFDGNAVTGSRVVTVETVDSRDAVDMALLSAVREGKCACWIRNTVDEATGAYDRLAPQVAEVGGTVQLFHARFAAGDREDIERTVLAQFGKESGGSKRARRIIIATQVVEQSLDIDFDFMVTDLAPIDLIIQRVGRLCRHLRNAEGERVRSGPDARGAPKLILHMPEWSDSPNDDWVTDFSSGTEFVYPHHERLWLTAKWLRERGELRIPTDLRDSMEYVYSGESDVPDGLRSVQNLATGKDRAAGSMAGFGCLDLDDGYGNADQPFMDEQYVPTRLGEKTRTVRLICLVDGALAPWGGEGEQGWAAGDVGVRIWYADSADSGWNPEGAREQACLASMPDKGKWVIPVAMALSEDGTWRGAARGSDGKRTDLIYDEMRGLRFARE